MPWLINAAQLDKFRKSQKSLIILDASWHMPADNRNAKDEFVEKHILDAKFFDIDAFSDPNPEAPHPHMLLKDDKVIGDKLGAMGIRNDYKIIFYDNSKLHSACRALWMLKMFGHNPQQLYLLDGGLNAWTQYGGKMESGEAPASPKEYTAKTQDQYVRTLSQMKSNLHNPKEQVVDVRHAVRYAGGPELRPGVRPGHIPGSFSFPYTSLFDKNDCWRPIEKIRMQLTGIGLDLTAPIVSTCGSGMSAPTLNFALDLLEHPHHAVYNGSWNEWGAEKLYANELSLDERPVIRSLDV
ncbi:MAG: rhodanese-like domain-containing protein [Gammaproteobacteria bacterium]|nr:rhodanese-like domain-containing protein [Gammaproteobacteria bacterium]